MSKAELATIPDLRELMRGEAVPEVEDPAIVKMRIVEQVLQAETVEDIFRNDQTVALGELVGSRIMVRDVVPMASAIKESSPVYLLIDAVDVTTGEKMVLNTSAARAMAQLWRAKEVGALPVQLQVVEVGRAKDGLNAPIGLSYIGPGAS